MFNPNYFCQKLFAIQETITTIGLLWLLCLQKNTDNRAGFANKSLQALFSNTALIKLSAANNTSLNRDLKFHPLPPTSREGEDFLEIDKASTQNGSLSPPKKGCSRAQNKMR